MGIIPLHASLPRFSMEYHPVKTMIIQDAVVDALRSGTLVIDFFIFLRTAWDFCIKADAPFGFRFYGAAIFGLGTVTAAFIGMTFAIWTAPHKFPTVPVKSIWHHTEAAWHKGVPFLSSLIVSGMVLGCPHLLFRSIKARIFQSFSNV